MTSSIRRSADGFSLIELAIVLVVIGLVIGGGLAALAVGTERQARAEQQRQFQDVRDALYGYAITNLQLPCPADPTAMDGLEARDDLDDPCDVSVGLLPWSTLGLASRDAWGHFLLYQVDTAYAEGPITLSQDSSELNDLEILDLDDTRITSSVTAVVVSFGGQGDQVWTAGGYNCPGTGGSSADGFSPEETANCDEDGTYYAGDYRAAEHENGRFDDLVIWIPEFLLKSRLVDAGQLP